MEKHRSVLAFCLKWKCKDRFYVLGAFGETANLLEQVDQYLGTASRIELERV